MHVTRFDREIVKALIATALGKDKADLVIKDASLVNVYTGEILEGIDVAVKGERIAYVGSDASHTIGSNTKVIDGKGKVLVPGFLDAHIHIESSMLTPLHFSEAVLPHGTTGVFIDPHEIANVLGKKGIEYFLNEAKMAPIRIFVEVPSCVPATPEDTTGGVLGAKEVAELLENPFTIGLGEVMDFHGLLNLRDDILEKIASAHNVNKVVDGHAPALSGKHLVAYVSAGITSDHESVEAWEIVEKARLGMHVMLREGSAWRDLDKTIRAILDYDIDTHMLTFVADDRNPYDIIHEGHMDYIVRKAIELGLDPVKAIQMATINVARRFRVEDDLGGIAPGKLADFIILGNLEKVSIEKVFVGGKLLAENGKSLWKPPKEYKIPKYLYGTINIRRKILPEDFKLKAPINNGVVKARVIGIVPNKAITRHLVMDVKVVNGEVVADTERDILKIAMVERYTGEGKVGLGLVHGFGFKYGALASSVAHDSHNILVVGVNENDMAYAVNKIVETGGGIVFVADGSVKALVKLPVAGILSDKPAEAVAEELHRLVEETKKAGSKLSEPHMTLSILGLIVIPELRVFDKGLFDVMKNSIVNVFVEQ